MVKTAGYSQIMCEALGVDNSAVDDPPVIAAQPGGRERSGWLWRSWHRLVSDVGVISMERIGGEKVDPVRGLSMRQMQAGLVMQQ